MDLKRLEDHEVEELLSSLPKWMLKDQRSIVRKYVFKEYLAGIDFVSRVGHLAEEANHHPFIEIQYKAVFITYTSWAERGLTKLDFVLAQKIEQLFSDIPSP
jgi:4a-hydroxytetrahydrobiopterin dehydratase